MCQFTNDDQKKKKGGNQNQIMLISQTSLQAYSKDQH